MAAEQSKCPGCAEATEEELLQQLDDVLQEYAETPGALIPVLQIAQTLFGYLPESALKKIALALGKPFSEVAGVVSFYSFFSTVPRGKHLVRACLGTACYVRGGKEVLSGLKQALNIEVGETTSDRLFSLDVGRCFGACGLAPVIMIDDDVHQRVKPTQLTKILDQYRTEEEALQKAKAAEESCVALRRLFQSSPWNVWPFYRLGCKVEAHWVPSHSRAWRTRRPGLPPQEGTAGRPESRQ